VLKALLSFALCGLGYALDLAWAQTFGLIMPRVQIELGISGAPSSLRIYPDRT
jgi:hypothetical protein